MAGCVPGVLRVGLGGRGHRRRRQRVRRPLPRRHRGDDRSLAAAHRRRGPGPRRQGNHRDAPDARRRRGRRGDAAALRPARLAVHALGDRREPVRGADRPPDHRSAEDPRPQPLLPRQRRRDRDHAGRRPGGSPGGQRRPARGPGGDHAGGRDQRPRGAGARARPRRRRLRAGRAGADQHRHRPRRGRLPRGPAPAHPRRRDAAGDRRDAHALLRPRRVHARPRASSPTC